MKLIKFNFLTLIFSALMTLNVGAGPLCTPDNDEFDDRIASQEGTNPEFELEDIHIPSKDELDTTIADNIANTAAETSEALEEPIMDSAILTTEVALEVIGVIGIAIIAGMAIYHIIEVFDDPDSTALDKVLSFTDFIFKPFETLFHLPTLGSTPEEKARRKRERLYKAEIQAVKDAKHYQIPGGETRNLTKFVSEIESILASGMTDVDNLEKIYAQHGRDLFAVYARQYFSSTTKLQKLLATMYAVQWMKGSPKFIALNNFLNHSIKGITATPPSILSSSTLELCSINADSNYAIPFKDMNPGKIEACLGDIFYDYKTHFSAYKIEDLITIKSPDIHKSKPPYTESDKMYSFSEFLNSYVKSYNHFLSNVKITYANDFYKQRKEGRESMCHSIKNSAEKFLKKAKKSAQKSTERMFKERYRLNDKWQSTDTLCWGTTPIYIGHNTDEIVPLYICAVIPYHPEKDEALMDTLDDIDDLTPLIDSQVEECLSGQIDSYVEFAKFLKNERITPLLDISNTAQSFTSILLGVKSSLLFSIRKKAKAFKMSNKK